MFFLLHVYLKLCLCMQQGQKSLVLILSRSVFSCFFFFSILNPLSSSQCYRFEGRVHL